MILPHTQSHAPGLYFPVRRFPIQFVSSVGQGALQGVPLGVPAVEDGGLVTTPDGNLIGAAHSRHVSGVTKAVSMISLFCFMCYVFLLPILSYGFNDGLGYSEILCTTPAEYIRCGDGTNYTLLAMKYNRFRDGKYWGCGCGEGVFGDWVCRVESRPGDHQGFSISYFISTPSSTGGMACFSFGPLYSMWLHSLTIPDVLNIVAPPKWGLGQVAPYAKTFYQTQLAFIVCYGLFMFNTTCIFPTAHIFFVASFLAAAIAHYVTLACHIGCNTMAGIVIITLCATACVALLLGSIVTYVVLNHIDRVSLIGRYAFWFGECVGLSCGFAIAPILLLIDVGHPV